MPSEPERHGQWVLDWIEDQTEPDPESDQMLPCPLWTSERQLLGHAGKSSNDYSKSAAEAAVGRLRDRGDILFWHGLLTLATDDYLQAVIESERNAGLTRKILVGKCNRLRQSGGGTVEVTADGE